jgi:hypothetical protein
MSSGLSSFPYRYQQAAKIVRRPADQRCRLQTGLSSGARSATTRRVCYLKVIRSVRLRVEALFFKGSFSAFELC